MARPPRRTSVANKPGIYYHLLASGERAYEFSYTDWRGKRRWKTIAGGLEDAEAAREEYRSRLRKGEKIGPTKATVAEVYRDWLKAQTKLRPRTLERYEVGFEHHVLPRFGHRRISSITVDDVAALVRAMEEGYRFRRDGDELREEKRGKPYAGWSIRATLTPFSKVMGYAVRRGLAASNPVKQLEGDERPEVEEREKRILEKDEIAKLLATAPERYHALLATAVFSGCRLGELLGLTWADVDLDAGEIHVRMQLGRDGRRVKPKTKKAVRSIVLMPALGRVLHKHKLSSAYSGPGELVFCSLEGTPLDQRNVARRGLEKAAKAAKLDGNGKPGLTMHALRHTFASLLIAQGRDVVYVSRQLGHAKPSITTDVYGHLFGKRARDEETRAALEADYGSLVEHRPPSPAVAAGAELVQIEAFRD